MFVNFRHVQHIPELLKEILNEYHLRKELNETYKELKVLF